MDWKNLYNKASDGLNTFKEETSQIESKVSRMSDNELLRKFKSGSAGARERTFIMNEIESRGIKHLLR